MKSVSRDREEFRENLKISFFTLLSFLHEELQNFAKECIKMTGYSLDVYIGMWLFSHPSSVKECGSFEIKASVGLRACPFPRDTSF